MNVTVTDPIKLSDTLSSYIVYRVNTSTNSAEFNTSECSCTRRYSDFEWLHDQLSFFFPASITPPLPEKQTVGRFTPEFIESRRRGIEKFMGRVTKHVILRDAACVASFLQTQDAAFAQCKAQYKQDRAAVSGSVAGWLGDKMNTMSTSTSIQTTEDDGKVEGALDYVLAWERQLTTVAKQSSQIVKSAQDKSKALFEFGQAFSSLGLNETNLELGNVLSSVGVAAAKLSSFQADAALAESIQFEEPMQECVRILHEIKAAVKRRGDKWQSLLNGTADLEAKQAAYQKVLGVAGKEDLATSKLVLVETAQERMETAQTELDEVTAQLLLEVAAFKVDKAVDFKTTCREFVKVLIELNNNTENIWKDLLPTLQLVSKQAPRSTTSAATSTSTSTSNSRPFADQKQQPKASVHDAEEEKEYTTSFVSPPSSAPPAPQAKCEEEDAPPPPPSNLMNEIDMEEEDEDEAGV